MTLPPLPQDVARAFDAMPDATRRRALGLRDRIGKVAAGLGIPTLKETLKWGEPAYLPGHRGTTVRIGWDPATGNCKLLVHCGTSLVESWRGHFGDRLIFEGNRAVLIDVTGWFDETALSACIADAFTYHSDARRVAHG